MFSKSHRDFYEVSEFSDLVCIVAEEFVNLTFTFTCNVLMLRVDYFPGRLVLPLSEGCSCLVRRLIDVLDFSW